jgi:outer membrane biosynthesis protein TonB
VEQELQNRGLQGRIDDPLLQSNIPAITQTNMGKSAYYTEQTGFEGKIGEDSSIGIGGMGQDEESHSIRQLDTSGKKPPPVKPGLPVQDDSVQHIVGTEPVKKKKNKKKKNKKDKSESNSEDDAKPKIAEEKPVRQSIRFNKPAEIEEIDD